MQSLRCAGGSWSKKPRAHPGFSSLLDFLDVRAVDGVNDIQRGAGFHCQLAGSNHRRPLGLYTNLSSRHSRMHRGWPSLFHLGSDLYYDGPLPPSREWTRARSSTPHLPRCWASSFGGGVRSHSWTLKTLPLGLEEQHTQRILAHDSLLNHSGIVSALLFLPYLLPHCRSTGLI